MSHIRDDHPTFPQLYEEYLKNNESDVPDDADVPCTSGKQKMIESFFDMKSNNIYKWLDWVCMDDLPLSFPEKDRTRKYSNLEKICTKTLKKYMFLVESEVYATIKKLLAVQTHVTLVFDGWSANSTHFIGLFVTYPGKDTDASFRMHLLRFAPLLDGTSFTAEAHRVFILETLDFYDVPLDKVVCLVGDNCNTNKALGNLLKKPLVGCRSHRLNLAVESFIEAELHQEVEDVGSLMSKLKTLKGSGRLKRLTGLKPRTRNKTRWTGTIKMFKRFDQLRPHTEEMDEDIKEIMPSTRQIRNIKDHMKELGNLEKVTIALQDKSMTLLKSEGLFEHIITSMPTFDFTKYLSPEADIVHNSLFEQALIKIQDQNEAHLSLEEKESVSMLLKDVTGMFCQIYFIFTIIFISLFYRSICR